jgi:hypothetical protein
MFRKLKGAAIVLTGVVVLITTGCASIVHGGPRNIPVASSPPGATVTIYDRDGKEVLKQTTPFTASLKPKYGYFKGQTYRVVFEMPGYKATEVQLTSAISGWYFGNILFGGVIGMVIVDPNTGAMYNLMPTKIDQTLSPMSSQATP